MVKQFKITVSSPVEIVGGYTVNDGLLVVVGIKGIDETPSDHDLIEYETKTYISEAAKTSKEPVVMTKGLVVIQNTKRGTTYKNHNGSVKSTDITYSMSVASGKRKLTPTSVTSLKENILGIVAGLLGKNVNDLTIS